MPLEILPASLHSLSSCELLLQSKESSLFHKTLTSSLINKKMYLSSIAILLVKKGQQVVHNYDSANLTVAENEIVILPKDIYVVSDFVTEEHHFEAFICFVDDELIKKFLVFHTPGSGVNQKESKLCKVRSNQQINRYIDLLFDTYRTKHSSPSSLHELKLIEFLLLLVDSDDDTKVISESPRYS
ncbi:hypothetical protein [Kangiella shandongensis]|uniref:hypothetical protein n=1 Tax=Kangiella shandongensis TaxID=2763258 RepID=UPI001CBFD27C|nr:hypothetical protein [Kangiella shandongensis]